ncbi:MAG: acetyl/propionyl-CoA carboxylase alpha subunit [Myxococcota bacterium]|jgi:acetyl/propionyl-CoA carboxylase alpha subunit
MRYHVRLEGRDEPLVVEVVADHGDRVEVLVDDVLMEFGTADMPNGAMLVNQAGSLQRVDVLGAGGDYEVLLDQRGVKARVIDERDTWLSTGGAADGGGLVTVAMPGKVVAIDVAEGDAVERGQRLLVVEAMKMENDVKSPRDGVVAAICVVVGDAIESGQTLIELE